MRLVKFIVYDKPTKKRDNLRSSYNCFRLVAPNFLL